MFELSHEVLIGKYKFTRVHSLEISESMRQLISTGTITLPRKVVFNKKQINLSDEGILSEGMSVEIKLGYDGDLQSIFKGVLKTIGAGFPIVLEIEGLTSALKDKQVKAKEWKAVTLETVLKYCLPSGLTLKAVDVNLGNFKIQKDTTASKVIDAIKSQYSLPIFGRGDIIYAGTTAWDELSDVHTLEIGFNVINNSLKYIKEEDIKIKVKAVSLQDDNEKLTIEVGDSDGDMRSLNFYNIKDIAALKAHANLQLKEIKYTGLHGTIETFGRPVIKHGDSVKIIDSLDLIKEKEGTYRVEKIDTRFGIGHGYRQTVTLGAKLSR
jgi:hypothetical protein